MRKYVIMLSLIFLFFSFKLQAQPDVKKWSLEAGPYIGIPAWSFSALHSFGFGVDAKAITDFGNNFSGGGEVSYGYFLGKDIGFGKASNFNMVGIYANLQYTYLDKYVVGGDLGLGLGFAAGGSTAAFARTGYLGYKFNTNSHPLTLALYLNRTTPATYNIGIKSWYRF